MSDSYVAETIISQLGGVRALRLMLGVDQFVYDDNSLIFKFKGSRSMNKVKITLTGMDDYNVEFSQVRKKRGSYEFTDKVKAKVDGIYADQLVDYFERTTGLCIRVPRIFRA